MMIYEMPPIPTGTTEQQLEQLREYLVRLITRLNEENRT